jgi:hypothetical protein
MRIFLWLVTIAFAILCFACWGMAHLVVRFLRDFRADSALPYFTQLVLVPHGWLLFCPLPWALAAAVMSFRRELSPSTAFIFAGVISIAMVVVLCAVVIAAVLPLIPMKM